MGKDNEVIPILLEIHCNEEKVSLYIPSEFICNNCGAKWWIEIKSNKEFNVLFIRCGEDALFNASIPSLTGCKQATLRKKHES